eukprot:Hpha_TRINITY_DN30719_c0_g1::TRINITY_DN30719_c0_g1_i1::g.28426::m.28426
MPTKKQVVREAGKPAVMGYMWKFSVIGRGTWKSKNWKRRWVTVNRNILCYYDDRNDQEKGKEPAGIVDFRFRPDSLTLYSSNQNEFAFCNDGYNHFLGLQYLESSDGKMVPLLLLLRCESRESHSIWVNFIRSVTKQEPFGNLKRGFPSFSCSCLEQSVGVEREKKPTPGEEAAAGWSASAVAEAQTELEASAIRQMEEQLESAREAQRKLSDASAKIDTLQQQLSAEEEASAARRKQVAEAMGENAMESARAEKAIRELKILTEALGGALEELGV